LPKAETLSDSNPTPTVAALAARLFLRKERRPARLRIAFSSCFIVFYLLCVGEFELLMAKPKIGEFVLGESRLV
jgi:hypothetical protein